MMCRTMTSMQTQGVKVTMKVYWGLAFNFVSDPYEPWHEISNNVVCKTSKASDQPARMRSLIRTFASRLNIL